MSGVFNEEDFLALLQPVWEDTDPLDASLGTATVRADYAIARWASELDTPADERSDFWWDLNRALTDQAPEIVAQFRGRDEG
jgi:hypothetical protein